MFVGQRMSHPVITASEDMSLKDALEMMHREQIRRMPVVNQHGKMIGIVSERVLLKASPSDATTLDVFEMKEKMRELKVTQFMTRDVTTVTEDTPLEEAARILTDQGISGMPVLRGGELVGFITMDDIFRVFLEVLGARETGLRVSTYISKSPGTIYHVTRAVFENGGDIRSLGLFLGESSENGEMIFKVTGLERERLTEAIKPHVEKIVDIR